MEEATILICKDCRNEFELYQRDIRFFEGNGLSLPKRCWHCRNQRRDNKRIDLTACIGKFITRTKASWTGDRSFLGKKIKLVDIDKDRNLYYQYPESSFFYEEGKVNKLDARNNDGYWKVVE